MKETDQIERLSQALFRAISPILRGQKPQHQGAALADMISIWLAGHFVLDDVQATYELRETLLVTLEETIRDLVPMTCRQVGTPVTTHPQNVRH